MKSPKSLESRESRAASLDLCAGSDSEEKRTSPGKTYMAKHQLLSDLEHFDLSKDPSSLKFPTGTPTVCKRTAWCVLLEVSGYASYSRAPGVQAQADRLEP